MATMRLYNFILLLSQLLSTRINSAKGRIAKLIANNAPINVLPQVTPRGRVGDLTYMKSIASPLERILGSNAPIIGLYISPIICKYWSNPPDPGHVYPSICQWGGRWGNTLIGA